MNGKICFVVYDPNYSFPLKKGEVVNLRNLWLEVQKKGLRAKMANNRVSIHVHGITFPIFRSGCVGACYLNSVDEVKNVTATLDFFFSEFVAKNIIKEGSDEARIVGF